LVLAKFISRINHVCIIRQMVNNVHRQQRTIATKTLPNKGHVY